MLIKKDKSANKKFYAYIIPSVAGMLVAALYTILDGIFVGNGLGENALGAVNIVFPLYMTVVALTMLIAIGGANIYSLYKGQNEKERAQSIFKQCAALLLIAGLAIGVFSLIFRYQICVLLGAKGEILELAVKYLTWAAVCMPIQMVSFGLGVFVRNDNSPKIAMAGIVIGSLTNAVLDYILLIVLRKGIEYSAITNIIGVSIELLICAVHFFKKDRVLQIGLPKFSLKDIKRVLANGFPSFLTEFSQSAITFSFNIVIVKYYFNAGVSAFAVVGYIGAFINMFLIGVTSGMQPLMSVEQGRGDTRKVAYYFRKGLLLNIIAAVGYAVICVLLGTHMINLFYGGNNAIVGLSKQMLNLYIAGFVPVGITMAVIMLFQVKENNIPATVLSLLRCVGFLQLSMFVLVAVFHAQGIIWAFPIGELLNFAVAGVLFMVYRRKKDVKIIKATAN